MLILQKAILVLGRQVPVPSVRALLLHVLSSRDCLQNSTSTSFEEAQ